MTRLKTKARLSFPCDSEIAATGDARSLRTLIAQVASRSSFELSHDPSLQSLPKLVVDYVHAGRQVRADVGHGDDDHRTRRQR